MTASIDIAGLGKRSQITDGGDRPGVHDRDEGGIVIGRDEHREDDHDQKRPLLRKGVFADFDPNARLNLSGSFSSSFSALIRRLLLSLSHLALDLIDPF
jgi:hypothetical protein